MTDDMKRSLKKAVKYIDDSHIVSFATISILDRAVSRHIPRKPNKSIIHYTYQPDLIQVFCPSCNRRLRTNKTTARGDAYCPRCGQCIDYTEGDA